MPSSSTPAFRLYLLRHAQSGWASPGQSDFDRTLDDTGYAQAEIIADMASDRGFKPELVLCSTAVRCRETAQAVRRAIREDLDIDFVDELYNGTSETYLDIIKAQSGLSSLMLVGHNPMMEETLTAILGQDASGRPRMDGYPPAGLAVIDLETPPSDGAPLSGRLVAWLTPRR